jgi:hypothetical protein
MKNIFLTLLLLFASSSFAQSVNDYIAVIIPMKYDFQKSDNQYRLQTITKINLQKAGFKAFYATEPIPAEVTDRCSLLYFDVKKDNGFLVTKLFVTFKDCFGNEIYKSDIGKSREKEYEAAYTESLNNVFNNVYALNYAYNGNTNFAAKAGITAQSFPVLAAPSVAAPSVAAPAVDIIPAAASVVVPIAAASTPKSEPKSSQTNTASLLYAQPTSYGYQLIDSEPKVVMKVYKTSNPASYMAKKGDIQGALVSKDNQWFFEYYQNDKLVSEKIDVKF